MAGGERAVLPDDTRGCGALAFTTWGKGRGSTHGGVCAPRLNMRVRKYGDAHATMVLAAAPQGLGKTVEVIALLLARMDDARKRGSTVTVDFGNGGRARVHGALRARVCVGVWACLCVCLLYARAPFCWRQAGGQHSSGGLVAGAGTLARNSSSTTAHRPPASTPRSPSCLHAPNAPSPTPLHHYTG